MTKRIKKGDVVRFHSNQSRWVIHSVWHGGTIVHMTLENEVMGEGAALSIPVRSLVKLQDATPETLEFVNVPVSRLT